jgi:hypothetical protein
MLLLLAFAAAFVGNDACRSCHSAIVSSYEQTAMARSSTPATRVPAGSFRADRWSEISMWVDCSSDSDRKGP